MSPSSKSNLWFQKECSVTHFGTDTQTLCLQILKIYLILTCLKKVVDETVGMCFMNVTGRQELCHQGFIKVPFIICRDSSMLSGSSLTNESQDTKVG